MKNYVSFLILGYCTLVSNLQKKIEYKKLYTGEINQTLSYDHQQIFNVSVNMFIFNQTFSCFVFKKLAVYSCIFL